MASVDNDSDDEIRPFKGFAKPLSHYKSTSTFRNSDDESDQQTNRLLSLIDEHVDEAMSNGFDDSIAKFKGKSHFVVRTTIIPPDNISFYRQLQTKCIRFRSLQ